MLFPSYYQPLLQLLHFHDDHVEHVEFGSRRLSYVEQERANYLRLQPVFHLAIYSRDDLQANRPGALKLQKGRLQHFRLLYRVHQSY